jgi:hypothetical protein
MTAKAKLLLGLLMLGILVVSVASVDGAPLDRSWGTVPEAHFDSVQLRIHDAALELFRQGCTEVRVAVFSDLRGGVNVFATCLEWQSVRPAAQ